MIEQKESTDLQALYAEASELFSLLASRTLPLNAVETKDGSLLNATQVTANDLLVVLDPNGGKRIFLHVMTGYTNNKEDASLLVADSSDIYGNLVRVNPDGTLVAQRGDTQALLEKCIVVKNALIENR